MSMRPGSEERAVRADDRRGHYAARPLGTEAVPVSEELPGVLRPRNEAGVAEDLVAVAGHEVVREIPDRAGNDPEDRQKAQEAAEPPQDLEYRVRTVQDPLPAGPVQENEVQDLEA